MIIKNTFIIRSGTNIFTFYSCYDDDNDLIIIHRSVRRKIKVMLLNESTTHYTYIASVVDASLDACNGV